MDVMRNEMGSFKIKSKTKVPDHFELTVEIRSKVDHSELVNDVGEILGVKNTAMLSYDGNYSA